MRGVSPPNRQEEDSELRRGPWTREEDNLLIHYITRHGEGRWNLLAKCAGKVMTDRGLKRAGKSCRLRWLNYLKPDIKRGNLSPQEQLLILELHYKWGNRWSKIAQHLPGRTDNEIKNYWRTRVQKQARQFNVESSSKRFLDAVRYFWMPRLLQNTKSDTYSVTSPSTSSVSPPIQNLITHHELPYNFDYRETPSSSTSHDAVISPDSGKMSNQSGVPDQGLPRTSDHVEGISVYYQSFNSGYLFDDMGNPDYNIDDMEAMSSLETPSSFCHVDGVDLEGHVVEDSFWTTGGLW